MRHAQSGGARARVQRDGRAAVRRAPGLGRGAGGGRGHGGTVQPPQTQRHIRIYYCAD